MTAKVKVKVRIDTSRLDRFSKRLREGLDGDSGPLAAMFRRWAARVFGFLQLRFSKLSRGGGEWPPLSPNTRRARGSATSAAILRDTGRLFLTLSPTGTPEGQVNQRIPRGLRIGIGGPAGYPGGRATLGDVAAVHQAGDGVPVRKIIVAPDAATMDGMRQDLDRAVQECADGG